MVLAASLGAGKLGGGDIKLAGLVAAIVGMPLAPIALTIGVMIGGSYALFLVVTGLRDMNGYIPYGVAISTGGCALMTCKSLLLPAWFGRGRASAQAW
jgi:leader peptidase (prepilin peptidase)/N-methyltransferase